MGDNRDGTLTGLIADPAIYDEESDIQEFVARWELQGIFSRHRRAMYHVEWLDDDEYMACRKSNKHLIDTNLFSGTQAECEAWIECQVAK
jgi:hypothetical protein